MSKKKIRNITIIGDFILINAGFALAYMIRYEWQWLRPVVFDEPYTAYLEQQLLLTVLLILTYAQSGVWQRRLLRSTTRPLPSFTSCSWKSTTHPSLPGTRNR
jgi:hypothetical protein